MLKHLRITNFAILSDVAIDFAPGMNVLSGETGAGKSLVVDAVALLRGGRASTDIPRTGADEAVVEAVFEPPGDLAAAVAARLEAAGLPIEGDGEVVVRRVIARGGRSRIHINGGLAPLAVLRDVAALLVDLAGQHEHQGLVDPARHLGILDAFAEAGPLVVKMAAAHERWRRASAELVAILAGERERAQREDFVRFQLDEIDAAQPKEGEEKTLGCERERLRAAVRLVEAARRGEARLYSAEGSVGDILGAVARELAPLGELDARLSDLARQIDEARLLVEDAGEGLRRYAGGVTDDPERLAAVDDRLHLLGRLFRKHGADTREVLARRAALADEQAALATRESRRAELLAERDAALAAAQGIAAELSGARRAAAARLEEAVTGALAELGMAGARLTVAVEPRRGGQTGDGEAGPEGRTLGPRGWDRVELGLLANRGEEPRPLARIASGGELSRIMLATKLTLRRADGVATYVFDEVDAGIGGATAEVVGRQIRRVAEERQVVCITHLAQIAALADAHFRVDKHVAGERTETSVVRLDDVARTEEIARMLGGVALTPLTRAHAEELLSRAGRSAPGGRPGRKASRAATGGTSA